MIGLMCHLSCSTDVEQDTFTVSCTVHGMLTVIPRASRMTWSKQVAKSNEVFQAHLRRQAGQEFPDVIDLVVRECLALEREIADLRAEADRKCKVLLDKLCDDLTAEQRVEYRRVLYGARESGGTDV